MQKGENSQSLKRNNRALVLKTVLTRDITTRVELAKATGLNKMTVGNIVADLIGGGYLAEGTRTNTGNVGRKPIELRLSSHAPKVVGIIIERKGVRAVLVDLQLRDVCKTQSIPFHEENADSVMEKAMDLAAHMIEAGGNILGIGVGIIGQHDVHSGNVLCPVDFFGIRDLPVKKAFMDRFGLPVYVDNDNNCAALAERMFGCGKDAECFLYVGITHGVGAGIVMGGDLLGNASGVMGEIGHMSIDINGRPCSCGNRGCLELYASIGWFESEAERLSGNYRTFSELVRAEDPIAEKVVIQGCDTLAAALTNAVNLLDPQLIIIGDEGAILPKKYLERIEKGMNARIILRDYKHIPIVRPDFGVNSSPYGAACLLIRQLFQGKLLSYST